MKAIGETITLNITNCPPVDVQFLRGLVAIFTDPANAELLKSLRAGDLAIHMDPATGHTCVTDIEDPTRTAPLDLVNFVGRFTDLEWSTLKAACDIREIAKQSVTLAEARTRDILGYLPNHLQQPQTAQG